MRKIFTLIIGLVGLSLSVFAQVGQGAIQGKIIDKQSNEPLAFANVAVYKDGVLAGGGSSDFDGKYSIKPLSPGKYSVKVTYVGYAPLEMTEVAVSSNQVTFLNLNMKEDGGIALTEFEKVEFIEPLIKQDDNTINMKIDRKTFERMPVRGINEAAAYAAGTVQDPGGGTSIRGGRTGANQTFIDGIKIRGTANLPRAAVENVEVVTGGFPAEIGDITGGATFVTTRGATTARFTSVEFLTSGFGYKDGETQKTFGLDNQGYNLGAFAYGGPLLRKRDEKGVKKDAIVSFIFSSEFIHIVDTRPSIIGTYKLKDDKLNELRQSPYMRPEEVGGAAGESGTILRSEYTVRNDDMEIVDTRQNASRRDINLNTNFAINTSDNTDLKIGATYFNQNRDVYFNDNALYNYYNNPERNVSNWRVYGRFTQRFANAKDEDGKEAASTIKNAYVTLQVDYERYVDNQQHRNHGDDFFKYGYVGQFESTYEISYEQAFDPELNRTAYVHNGWNQTAYKYYYRGLNPDLANYTNMYYDLYKNPDGSPQVDGRYDNYNNVVTNTLVNGNQPRNVYEMWRGQGYNNSSYIIDDRNQFRLTAQGAADIKSHEIKIGFEFEQRVDRGYQIANPAELWNIGRQEVNFHIQQLDTTKRTVTYANGFPYVTYERLVNHEEGEMLANEQFMFDYNVRKELGFDPYGNDFIDFDNYDPSTYKIDFFSAEELINQNSNLGLFYYGYDYTGEKESGNPTLEDFFSEEDEFGKKTRRIDAFRPIYAAGYIQDKFTYKDLIFRLGLRVDYFDANQPVLIDEYSLFPTVSAGELTRVNQAIPSNIGSDYVVYVDNDGSELADLNQGDVAIIGYRNPEDDTWYDASGALVTRPTELTGSTTGRVYPLLQDGDRTVTNTDLDARSFEDYKPQITPMPRVSFSFPVSSEASIFANYDVLISRPTERLQFRPTDYLYLSNSNAVINNPNLKGEKRITYELGFKQVLSQNSAITLSAFYAEMRDQIQLFKFDGAYPVTYTSFANIDFGTVTGFTVSYDYRQIKNVGLQANYTLQFAQGTGSTSGSQLVFVNSSSSVNLKNISYLNNDRRHQINIIFDYHYGTGKDYNGPKIKGKDVLSNAGFNIGANAASGGPFSKWTATRSQVIYGTSSGPIEGLNESRLPWTFNVDMRIDKRFPIVLGSKAKDNRKPASLEVYFQILNVLNTRNVIDVWNSTGNPEDDGYLTDAASQPVINTAVNPDSYVDNYQARIHTPGFYAQQRRMRLGVVLNF